MTKYAGQTFRYYDGKWKEELHSGFIFSDVATASAAAAAAMDSSTGLFPATQWTVVDESGKRVARGTRGDVPPPAGSPASDSPPAAGGVDPAVKSAFDPAKIASGLILIGVTAVVVFVTYMATRYLAQRAVDE